MILYLICIELSSTSSGIAGPATAATRESESGRERGARGWHQNAFFSALSSPAPVGRTSARTLPLCSGGPRKNPSTSRLCRESWPWPWTPSHWLGQGLLKQIVTIPSQTSRASECVSSVRASGEDKWAKPNRKRPRWSPYIRVVVWSSHKVLRFFFLKKRRCSNYATSGAGSGTRNEREQTIRQREAEELSSYRRESRDGKT